MHTSHSEYGTIKSLWIKPVKHGFVDQQMIDSQWIDLNFLECPSYPKALQEYDSFKANFYFLGPNLKTFGSNDEKTLAGGNTYRTNPEGIRQLKALLEPKGIEVLIVDLPHYKGPSDVFHLMSILSPVDKDLAVIYSPLMPISFRNELIRRGFEFIEVPEDEFDSMGCRVTTYQGDEISYKGGGGPTCLTRPMMREI